MKTILVTLALATAAVSTAQAEHYRPSVVRDTTIVGAVAGALIGGHNGDRWAEGAIVGAAAGAVVGAVVDSNRSRHVYREIEPVAVVPCAPTVVVSPPPRVVYVNPPPRRVVYVNPAPTVVVQIGSRHGYGHHRRHHHHHRHHHHRRDRW